MVNWWQDVASPAGTAYTTIGAIPIGIPDVRTFFAEDTAQASGFFRMNSLKHTHKERLELSGTRLAGI